MNFKNCYDPFYGLTDKETNKVLKEFRTIISDKIESRKLLNK